MTQFEVFHGDITQLEVDAIVNAANTTLLGGGGVDGAIHKAAGKGLLDECRTLNGCRTGEAKITSGYNLPAKFVIHAVGPIWKGGQYNEDILLESAYKKSIRLAANMKLKTIAFPNISTGAYGFPKDQAARIAVRAVREALGEAENIEKVIFCVYDEENREIYNQALKGNE